MGGGGRLISMSGRGGGMLRMGILGEVGGEDRCWYQCLVAVGFARANARCFLKSGCASFGLPCVYLGVDVRLSIITPKLLSSTYCFSFQVCY